MDKLKLWLAKLNFFHRPRAGAGINLPRAWFWLFLFFLAGLTVSALGLFRLDSEITGLAAGAVGTSTLSAKINDKKFELIKADWDKRSAEFLKWQNEKPAVVDPGV